MGKPDSEAVLRQIHTLFSVGIAAAGSRTVSSWNGSSRAAMRLPSWPSPPWSSGTGRWCWAVCRRILADPHDAEDAFQATFLVLVRQAGSIRVDGSVGRWLYGVATRVAARQGQQHPAAASRERSGLNRIEDRGP